MCRHGKKGFLGWKFSGRRRTRKGTVLQKRYLRGGWKGKNIKGRI